MPNNNSITVSQAIKPYWEAHQSRFKDTAIAVVEGVRLSVGFAIGLFLFWKSGSTEDRGLNGLKELAGKLRGAGYNGIADKLYDFVGEEPFAEAIVNYLRSKVGDPLKYLIDRPVGDALDSFRLEILRAVVHQPKGTDKIENFNDMDYFYKEIKKDIWKAGEEIEKIISEFIIRENLVGADEPLQSLAKKPRYRELLIEIFSTMIYEAYDIVQKNKLFAPLKVNIDEIVMKASSQVQKRKCIIL